MGDLCRWIFPSVTLEFDQSPAPAMSVPLTSSTDSQGQSLSRVQSDTALIHNALSHSQSRAREAEVALRTFDRLLDEAVEAIAIWATDKGLDPAAAKQIETILTPVLCWRAAERERHAPTRSRGGRSRSNSSSGTILPDKTEQTGLLAVIATKNDACRQSNKLRKRVLFLLGRTLVITRRNAVNTHHRMMVGRWSAQTRCSSRKQPKAVQKVLSVSQHQRPSSGEGTPQPSWGIVRVAVTAAGVALVVCVALSLARHLQALFSKRRAGNLRVQSLKALGPSQYLPQAALLGVREGLSQ